MKKLLSILIILIIFITSCNTKKFDQLKKGMKTTEVKALVGDPITKKDMIFVEWWMYNDLKNHIVIIGGDSVVNITTKKEFEEDMKDAFDSILKP